MGGRFEAGKHHPSSIIAQPFRMSVVLTLLRIKNLALVEELEWQMPQGFIAVTGETGAGKSIIIGALQLLLGERADKSLIRTGADLCTVEAVFSGDDLRDQNTLTISGLLFPFGSNFLSSFLGISSGRYEQTNSLDWIVFLFFIRNDK